MNYIGEHLLPGELGRLATSVAFVFSLGATFFFWKNRQNPDQQKTARWMFTIHGIAVLTLVLTLFYIMFNHYFEYDYAWKHTSTDLPTRFLFAAFWEGQEGSFILWIFWHVFLGWALLYFKPPRLGTIMAVVSSVQAFLTSMVLGIYPFGLKVGSSPFVLIRELPENINLPWTQLPDYLQRIPAFMEGNGLNPLLQNYWMTIHPPVLFLGFASTLIPFAFALGGLLDRDYKGWIKPALPWTYFSIGILGLGILMGGAWAYEALSFGGFWAWDPVENSSLVPWLVIVAAAHLMLIERNRGNNLGLTLLLTLGGFLLVLYSTFLTRSGILGDTSVHAFVDLGLSGQLLIYLLFFSLGSLALWAMRLREIPRKTADEPFLSREFWMFLGALILLVSSFQITFSTSLPVVNKLFGPEGWFKLLGENLAPPIDAIAHYNSFQVPFAIAIALLMALGQFLNYKGMSGKMFFKRIALSLVLAAVFTAILDLVFSFHSNPFHLALLFTSLLAVFGNLDYWARLLKGKAQAGASMAHIGFGLIILGSLISNGKKDTISSNKTFIAKDFPQNENLLLELGDTTTMGEYRVVWTGERQEGKYRIYDMNYRHVASGLEFNLAPTILMNERMGPSAEPSTRHTLGSDLYTHITYADVEPKTVDAEGFLPARDISMRMHDTLVVAGRFLILHRLTPETVYADGNKTNPAGIYVYSALAFIAPNGVLDTLRPVYSLQGSTVTSEPAYSSDGGIRISFAEIKPETGEFVFAIAEKAGYEKPFIVIKASIFPMINLLWLGCILMVVGSFIAMYERSKQAA